MRIERHSAAARAAPALVAGLTTALFAAACAAFARQPALASFADDSVSYLVMAQVFSPWAPASAPVAEAFVREAFYPPLFPLLLALLGAAHDIGRAYAVTALLQAACLPLFYALAARLLESRGIAALATVVVSLLPSLWIHTKGILSEPLFSILLIATLHQLQLQPGRARAGVLAALMAAMVLTRTVGVPVVAAYALWALTRRGSWHARLRRASPALVAAGAYGAWLVLRPADTTDNYGRIIGDLARSLLASDDPLRILWLSLARQANAIGEAWIGGVMLFWVEGRPLRVALAALAGVLALAGMARRLLAGEPDGWMVAAYVAIFMLWPFSDQVTRFLLPVLPVLVLYAFQAAGAALGAIGRPVMAGHGVLALLLASLSLPGLAFIHARAGMAVPHAATAAWYRTPDLDEARARAQTQLDLLADMDAIRRLTAENERVMWYVPSYVALLAGRHAVRSPDSRLSPADYRAALEAAGPDYVFLSLFHPRDTRSDAAWQLGVTALSGKGAVVHARRQPDGTFTSFLVRVR